MNNYKNNLKMTKPYEQLQKLSKKIQKPYEQLQKPFKNDKNNEQLQQQFIIDKRHMSNYKHHL